MLDGGRRVPVTGPRQKALLAILLLNANEVVSRDRLIDELWERPPESAENALHRVVSQLRKQLDVGEGAPMPLVTRAPGYVLEIAPEALDLHRFETLVATGRAALREDDPQTAARTLREALALWRGPALADLQDASFAGAEVGRLEELRLQAVEERIEADLRRGRAQELVPELEGLVAQEPLRERLRSQLMLALYRSGRQADALAAYRDARRRLVEDLGIEPGPQLQELERAILRQDPSLDAPSVTARAPRPRRRRNLWAGLAFLLAAAAAVVTAVLLTRDGSDATAITDVPPNSVAVIDPGTNRIADVIPVGSRPIAVAVGEGSVWVANVEDGTLSRIDPRTREVVRTIGLGTPATDVAAGYGSVWVANGSAGTLSRVDPNSSAVAETYEPGAPGIVAPVAQAVTVGWGSVWLTSGPERVLRIDPATGGVSARVAVDIEPTSLAVGRDAVWVGSLERRVARIDPRTNTVTDRIPLAGSVFSVAAGGDTVWAAACCQTAWRIDALRNVVQEAVTVGEEPSSVAVGERGVWVTNYADGTVSRIDPARNKVVATIRVGHRPLDLAVGDGAVWVAVQAEEVS